MSEKDTPREKETQKEIDAVPWRKTEYIAPHEYISVMDYPDLVAKITKHIKEEGILREFRGVKYRYFYFGGYRYWRMGVILNRAITKKCARK